MFPSETRLYTHAETNHRTGHALCCIYDRLLSTDDWDNTLLFPRIAAAAEAMAKTLQSYKQDQLPGGTYWDPNDHTKAVHRQLKPNNDICESLLGLKDWISAPLVNAKQHTKTALIESKRNKTMAWLNEFTTKDAVINLAVKEREAVQKESRDQEMEVQKKKREGN